MALALRHVLAVVAESPRRGLTATHCARIVNLADEFIVNLVDNLLWHGTGAPTPASGSLAAERP